MRKLFLRIKKRRRERGQGMTEYIIIVALVAIGAIAVVTIFGDNIRALFGTSANALTGDVQHNALPCLPAVPRQAGGERCGPQSA